MKEFLSYIIGNATVPQFLAALFFAYITAFAMFMHRTTKRDPLSPNTPVAFDYGFFFRNNAPGMVCNIIFIFLFVRLLQLWIGPEYTVYVGLAIGFVSYKLAQLAELLQNALFGKGKNLIKKINGDEKSN